jgi:hypothetical protein
MKTEISYIIKSNLLEDYSLINSSNSLSVKRRSEAEQFLRFDLKGEFEKSLTEDLLASLSTSSIRGIWIFGFKKDVDSDSVSPSKFEIISDETSLGFFSDFCLNDIQDSESFLNLLSVSNSESDSFITVIVKTGE